LISLAQVPRLEQHRAPTTHRQLAHGRHPGEATTNDHDIPDEILSSPRLWVQKSWATAGS